MISGPDQGSFGWDLIHRRDIDHLVGELERSDLAEASALDDAPILEASVRVTTQYSGHVVAWAGSGDSEELPGPLGAFLKNDQAARDEPNEDPLGSRVISNGANEGGVVDRAPLIFGRDPHYQVRVASSTRWSTSP